MKVDEALCVYSLSVLVELLRYSVIIYFIQ